VAKKFTAADRREDRIQETEDRIEGRKNGTRNDDRKGKNSRMEYWNDGMMVEPVKHSDDD
jgi:hypothetical protein